MTCGVYYIKHSSGRIYVGSSVNIENRFSVHKWQLRHGKHGSCMLQDLWLRTDESEWVFMVVEECEQSSLRQIEQEHLDRLSEPLNNKKNSRGFGHKWSEATKERIRAGRARYLEDPEARRKLSDRAKAQHAAGKLGAKTWNNGPKQDPEKLRERGAKAFRDHIASQSSEEMARRSMLRRNIRNSERT